MREYALYPSAVQEAVAAHNRGEPAAAAVRALLQRPDGQWDGLALLLLARRGIAKGAADAAAALGADPDELAAAVSAALPDGTSERYPLTGAEAVALTLRQCGARLAFGYAGTSELALCDALVRLPGVRAVNGRGDTESAFMAAGASLFEPAAAVAVLHGARGLTNATGAVADARRNEIAVVALVGLPSTGSAPFLPPHGEPDLLASVGTFAKSWVELGPVPEGDAQRRAAAAHLAAVVRGAFSEARTPPFGPVLVGIPQDVAEAAWVPPSALDPAPATSPPRRRVPQDLDAACRLLDGARRPLVLVDDYLLKHERAQPVLGRFAAALGAPVLQARYRRGAMLFERIDRQAVPTFLGWLDPADLSHRKLLEHADVLVTVEDRNLYQRVVGRLPDCPKVAVTSDGDKTRKNDYLRRGDLLLEGDAVAVLARLGERVGAAATARPAWWEGLVEADGTAGHPQLPPVAERLQTGLVRALGRALATVARPVLVDDSQMLGGVVAEWYDELPASTRVVGDHGGFVGAGIAYATGLALADPSAAVVCTLGDQGLVNGLQGLVAAGQERAPAVYVVCNNGGSVSLLKQARAARTRLFDEGRDPFLANAANADYTGTASRLGLAAAAVEFPAGGEPDALAAAAASTEALLASALASRQPTLIELRLPPLGDAWAGVWRTEGYDEPHEVGLAPSAAGRGQGRGGGR